MISVIVPVYNTGKKLNKCLSSLYNQTYTDWECLLVNDCSRDETTIRIMNEWVCKDKRFVLINNQRNLGIEKNRFVAVNKILAENRSKFIMFMDHDDWLYSDKSLAYLYDNAIISGADVTIGRHNEAHFFLQTSGYNPVNSGIISQPELKNKYYISYFGVNLMPVFVWARLYKVELVKRANLRAHGLVSADDVAWNLFIMPFAKSVMMLDKVVYVHRWGGVSSKSTNQGLVEYKKFYQIRRQSIDVFDFPQGRFNLDCELKNVLASYIYYSILYSKLGKEEIILYLTKELKDDIWLEIDESIKKRDDSFSIALSKRDYEKMYEIQYQKANTIKNKLLCFIKRALRYIG